MQLRLNSADDPVVGEPERITENGTEYLQVPVVAGQEQIYSYTDQRDAYDYEFLPGGELSWGVGRANGALDIVLDHPVAQTPAGPSPTLVGNAASGAEVDDAEYRDLRMDDSETKVRGNLLLPTESRTAYGPAYTEAFDTLEDGGTWPVSLGYNVGEIDPTPGRHNGQQYEAIQRQPALDHLALVMNGKARCSPSQGCAAGRANAEQEDDTSAAAFGEPLAAGRDNAMSNQQYPEQDKGHIAGALETLGSAFGIGVETTPHERANAESKSVAGVSFTGTSGGKLDKSKLDADEHTLGDHYLVGSGDSKGDYSYPVVDASGTLRAGNVESAWNMRGSGDDVSKSTLEDKLKKLAGEFGSDPLPDSARENAAETSTENSTESDDAADTAAADSGRTTTENDTQDPNDMTDPESPDDEQMIDYLVSEDGPNLDRENMEPLEGEECLGEIYQRFNSESESEDDGDGDGEDDPDTESEGDDTPDDPDSDDEPTGRENSDDPAVTFDTEDDFKSAVADVVEERENAKEQESLIDWIDSRSERYNAEMLEGTPSGVLEEIADDVVEESRANAAAGAGAPEAWSDDPPQADRSPMRTDGPVRANAGDDPDVPVGNDPFGTAESGGED